MTLQESKSYRDYLRQRLGASRSAPRGVTPAALAKRAGLSPSALRMILSGRRNLTSASAFELGKAFRFTPAEMEYWETLIAREDSKSAAQKAHYGRRLSRLKTAIRGKNVALDRPELLSETWIPRLLIHLDEIRKQQGGRLELDAREIGDLAEKLQQSAAEVRRKVDHILDIGILKRDESGEVHFVLDRLGRTLPQKQYLKTLLAESASRIDSGFDRDDHYFSAFTFSTTPEELHGLHAELKELMDRYIARSGSKDPATCVAQASFQVFRT